MCSSDLAELYAFLRVENPAPDTTPFNIDVEHGFAVFDNNLGHCIYSLDARIANSQLTKSDPIPEFFAPVEEFTDQKWLRLRGRQIAFRISSESTGVQWSLGIPRLDISPDGLR